MKRGGWPKSSDARSLAIIFYGLFLLLLPAWLGAQTTLKRPRPDRDNQKQRQAFFMRGRQSLGALPAAEHLRLAWRQARRLPLAVRKRPNTNSPNRHLANSNLPATAGSWTEAGPSPEYDMFYGNVSGRVTALAVDLADDPSGNTVYLGAAYGGVWVSTNALSSSPNWKPLTDGQPSLSVGAIALTSSAIPGEPTIVVGTGEPDNAGDSYYGIGLLVSHDGGGTWTQITSADNGKEQFLGAGFSKILVDPNNPQILLAAVSSTDTAYNVPYVRGIYRSTDGGDTWSLVKEVTDSSGNNYSCTDLVYDSTTATYLAAFRGAGFFKSTNQGATWAALSASPFVTAAPSLDPSSGFDNFYRASMAARSGVIYAIIADSNSQLSTPLPCTNGQTSGCDTGLVQSTNDGGSWTPIAAPTCPQTSSGSYEPYCTGTDTLFNAGGGDQGDYDQLIFAPPKSNTLVVGGIDLWETTLGSASLAPPLGLRRGVPFQYSPIAWLAIGLLVLFLYIQPQRLSRVRWAGWLAVSFISLGLLACGGGGSSSNPNPNPTPTPSPTVSWSDITRAYGTGTVHADEHAIAAVDSTTWIIGNDGGIWSTSNSGTNWNDMNNGLGTIQFYSVTSDPVTAGIYFGGSQDNDAAISGNGTNPPSGNLSSPLLWTADFFGDGGYSATTIATVNGTQEDQYFTENNGVSLARSDSGGSIDVQSQTGSFYNSSGYPNVVVDSSVIKDGADFYVPYQILPTDNSQIILGTCRVWIGPSMPTSDGAGWSAISNDLTTGGSGSGTCAQNGSYITALAQAPSNSATLYAVTDDGQIAYTTNATCIQNKNCATGAKPTWQHTTPLPLLTTTYPRPLSSIAVSPANAQTIFVGVMDFGPNQGSGSGGQHIFMSTDAGTTWTDITGDLPDSPLNWILVDPQYPQDIYVATDVGVFVTQDGGAGGAGEQWQQLGIGLPASAVLQLNLTTVGAREIIAATHGRGAWTIPTVN